MHWLHLSALPMDGTTPPCSMMHQATTQPFLLNPKWFMERGVASHVARNPGILTSSYSPLARSASHIAVGTLIFPSLVKKIILAHKFTHHNLHSIEFDPFGFCERDLTTRAILVRYNSHGDLYPFFSNNGDAPSAALIVSSQDLWQRQLRHLGAAIMVHFPSEVGIVLIAR